MLNTSKPIDNKMNTNNSINTITDKWIICVLGNEVSSTFLLESEVA